MSTLSSLRNTVEALIRLFKADVHAGTVLVSRDNMFEIKNIPSILLQGPVMTEDRSRRTMGRIVEKDIDNLEYEGAKHPRLYHLDFDVVITTAKQTELLEIQEKLARFYQLHPELEVEENGTLNLTELVPAGGVRRVNLSNLKQISGRLRIEDCPIYDGIVETGKLVREAIFDYNSEEL